MTDQAEAPAHKWSAAAAGAERATTLGPAGAPPADIGGWPAEVLVAFLDRLGALTAGQALDTAVIRQSAMARTAARMQISRDPSRYSRSPGYAFNWRQACKAAGLLASVVYGQAASLGLPSRMAAGKQAHCLGRASHMPLLTGVSAPDVKSCRSAHAVTLLLHRAQTGHAMLQGSGWVTCQAA